MAVVSTLTTREDFTGEFKTTPQTGAMWRFNEAAPDGNTQLADSSDKGRPLRISGWSGTTASLIAGRQGRYFRFNTNNPATEKTYLTSTNDGNFFSNLGGRIGVGGWIMPRTYSISNQYTPIFNTRQGPGQPLLYISLLSGRPRMMLYNAAGSLILDKSETPSFTMQNNGWYFLASVIDTTDKTSQTILCDRSNGAVWVSPLNTFTDDPNPSCTANIVLGMHANQYWYAGGLDEWFFETDSALTIEDLRTYFYQSLLGNGADNAASVDAYTEPGSVMLRNDSGVYRSSGQLETTAALCGIAGTGRIAISSEYTAGVTAVSAIETATSDDLVEWTAFQQVGPSGELQSPVKQYIRYRITLTTSDTTLTPKLLDISLHEMLEPAYKRLGYARPIVLGDEDAWDAVLERAYDIIVTGEINGADTLEFKLPFNDSKRSSLENEKRVQIVDDTYRIRTISDEKGTDGSVITSVYAEAAFYDLAYSGEKTPVEFNAALADEAMLYALEGTDWTLGLVDVSTLRTWECKETNALAILRMVQGLHGGDLIFDSREKKVHLLSFGGQDSGALFAFRKNLHSVKRVVDTRSLVTRLYAVGKDGLTFASINNGYPYVEDFTYSPEIRISTLDLSGFSNPYQMLEFTRMRLAEYAKPRVSYVLSAMDLSVLTGYEHEQWTLGDIVTVDDRDLNLLIKTRIIRRQYNLQEPWNTVLELSTKLRELGDASNETLADTLDQPDSVQQEIKDMVPFNHLRNSRADDALAYWVNSGFEVDAENGVSGTASFKAEGVLGMTKSLSQTVYPASRRNYTISAEIGSENLQKGPNGQVGLEIVFEFEDGSIETRVIDLY
ncbi:phage tail protein [Eubacteriales bacterium OttesenSCG-928-A19]|nr:phage tail protein [Eubacteriales bacterium OttesenSCG-928-A19]